VATLGGTRRPCYLSFEVCSSVKPVADPVAKRKRQKGVTTVEYAVMLVLIAIAVMIANPNLSSSVVGVFANISSRLAG